MNKNEYDVLFNVEDTYWWHVGLRNLVFSCIDNIKKKKNIRKILDAGCGTGKILEDCKEYTTFGMDASEEALTYCKLRRLDNLVRSSISRVPFKRDSFDLVISIDVLYHKGVESDVDALKEIYQMINKNGVLLLQLPAYNFMRRKHDVAVHTRDRYTKNNLIKKVQEAGFKIEKITYRNTLLFPIAFIKMIIEKLFPAKKAESELEPLPSLVNTLFATLLFFENKLITLGINLPFGLSIYCIAKKMN
jgi:SAM-dependent methyltransferase